MAQPRARLEVCGKIWDVLCGIDRVRRLGATHPTNGSARADVFRRQL